MVSVRGSFSRVLDNPPVPSVIDDAFLSYSISRFYWGKVTVSKLLRHTIMLDLI